MCVGGRYLLVFACDWCLVLWCIGVAVLCAVTRRERWFCVLNLVLSVVLECYGAFCGCLFC